MYLLRIDPLNGRTAVVYGVGYHSSVQAALAQSNHQRHARPWQDSLDSFVPYVAPTPTPPGSAARRAFSFRVKTLPRCVRMPTMGGHQHNRKNQDPWLVSTKVRAIVKVGLAN